jgi:hypothetical protein
MISTKRCKLLKVCEGETSYLYLEEFSLNLLIAGVLSLILDDISHELTIRVEQSLQELPHV